MKSEAWSLTTDPGTGLFDGVGVPYQAPLTWTADHVLHRLIEAWETLARLKIRVGPRRLKASWPRYSHTFEDLLAQESPAPGETKSQAELRRSGERRLVVLPPSPHDLSLMEEAFGWPLSYLAGQADVAVVRWSYCRYRQRDVAPSLLFSAYREAETIASALRTARKAVR